MWYYDDFFYSCKRSLKLKAVFWIRISFYADFDPDPGSQKCSCGSGYRSKYFYADLDPDPRGVNIKDEKIYQQIFNKQKTCSWYMKNLCWPFPGKGPKIVLKFSSKKFNLLCIVKVCRSFFKVKTFLEIDWFRIGLVRNGLLIRRKQRFVMLQ